MNASDQAWPETRLCLDPPSRRMGHQFELLIEKRMIGMCYPETSNLNTAMRR